MYTAQFANHKICMSSWGNLLFTKPIFLILSPGVWCNPITALVHSGKVRHSQKPIFHSSPTNVRALVSSQIFSRQVRAALNDPKVEEDVWWVLISFVSRWCADVTPARSHSFHPKTSPALTFTPRSNAAIEPANYTKSILVEIAETRQMERKQISAETLLGSKLN